jgi:predicted nucleic acid-binding protein
MTVVVDASVVVAALASADATGQWAESVLAGGALAAPHLMPAEAANILRRAELAGEISADTASLAHADLGRLRVEYFPYDPFAERIWELRSSGLAVAVAGSGGDDPREPLDYSFKQQAEMLLRVRRGVADCDTSRKRVELQMAALAESSGELERRAREALAAGREDLAQESLIRRNAVEAELGDLRNQHQSLREQTDRLTAASERLRAKTEAMQARVAPGQWQQAGQQAGERPGRQGLTSYEAWYVALAEFLGAKLATLDTRLALAPGPRCGFCLPPSPPT